MRVGLIGAGNMARALARGWGDPVLASDGGSGRARALAEVLGGEATSNRGVAAEADIVVLAHKPYQLRAVADEIAGAAKAVVSLLGGVTLGDLELAFPGTPVARLMPNTPVEVRRGVSCYSVPDDFPPELEREIVELFERVGWVVRLDERLLDAATALMGVGPAYFALLAEADADAGVRLGLTAPLAGRLVAETMAGTAELLRARDYDTLSVRREVTSPGGSTARGLAALEAAGVRGAFQDAADAVLGTWGGR
jgi:pyrroline-5-carboxylate reductase